MRERGKSKLTSDGLDDLVSNVADLEERVGMVLVVLEEVEHAETQHVKREADVAAIVEPVQHLDTDTEGRRGRYSHMGQGLPATTVTIHKCQRPAKNATSAMWQLAPVLRLPAKLLTRSTRSLTPSLSLLCHSL